MITLAPSPKGALRAHKLIIGTTPTSYKLHLLSALTTTKPTKSITNSLKGKSIPNSSINQSKKERQKKEKETLLIHKQIKSLIAKPNILKKNIKKNSYREENSKKQNQIKMIKLKLNGTLSKTLPNSTKNRKSNSNANNYNVYNPFQQLKQIHLNSPTNSNNNVQSTLAFYMNKIGNFHSSVNSGNLMTSSKMNRLKLLTKQKTNSKNKDNILYSLDKSYSKEVKNHSHGKLLKKNNKNLGVTNITKANEIKMKPKIKIQQKQIITTTNSVEKIIYPNLTKPVFTSNNTLKKFRNDNQYHNYAKIFGLLNNEIKEITDLFKRTQSVDQQKKISNHIIPTNSKKQLTETNPFNNNMNDIIIDYTIFEKEFSEDEKLIDISQLDNDEILPQQYQNPQSILFSSYNSEFYENLVNNNDNETKEKLKLKDDEFSEEEFFDCINQSSISSRNNNILKIAHNNIYINNLLQNNNVNYEEDLTHNSEKTEYQFGDVVFNQYPQYIDNNNNIEGNFLEELEKTEKTYNILNEKDRIEKVIPIRDVMKQLRNNK